MKAVWWLSLLLLPGGASAQQSSVVPRAAPTVRPSSEPTALFFPRSSEEPTVRPSSEPSLECFEGGYGIDEGTGECALCAAGKYRAAWSPEAACATCEAGKVPSAGSCFSGKFDARVESFGGSCYYFSAEEKVWTSAEGHCQELGGHLVVFNGHGEAAEVARLAGEYFDDFWIGLNERGNEKAFDWTNPDVCSDYRNWYVGNEAGGKIDDTKEPTDDFDGESYRCVRSDGEGRLYDENCRKKPRHYVCEAPIYEGASRCSPCRVGYYSARPGDLECKSCSFGTFADDEDGAATCEACPSMSPASLLVRQFSTAGSVQCGGNLGRAQRDAYVAVSVMTAVAPVALMFVFFFLNYEVAPFLARRGLAGWPTRNLRYCRTVGTLGASLSFVLSPIAGALFADWLAPHNQQHEDWPYKGRRTASTLQKGCDPAETAGAFFSAVALLAVVCAFFVASIPVVDVGALATALMQAHTRRRLRHHFERQKAKFLRERRDQRRLLLRGGAAGVAAGSDQNNYFLGSTFVCTLCRSQRANALNLPCSHQFFCVSCADLFRKENGDVCNACRAPSIIRDVLVRGALLLEQQQPPFDSGGGGDDDETKDDGPPSEEEEEEVRDDETTTTSAARWRTTEAPQGPPAAPAREGRRRLSGALLLLMRRSWGRALLSSERSARCSSQEGATLGPDVFGNVGERLPSQIEIEMQKFNAKTASIERLSAAVVAAKRVRRLVRQQFLASTCASCAAAEALVVDLPCGHATFCERCSKAYRQRRGDVCPRCARRSTTQRAVSSLCCSVCFDVVGAESLVGLGTCGHHLCTACTVGYVRSALSNVAEQVLADGIRCPLGLFAVQPEVDDARRRRLHRVEDGPFDDDDDTDTDVVRSKCGGVVRGEVIERLLNRPIRADVKDAVLPLAQEEYDRLRRFMYEASIPVQERFNCCWPDCSRLNRVPDRDLLVQRGLRGARGPDLLSYAFLSKLLPTRRGTGEATRRTPSIASSLEEARRTTPSAGLDDDDDDDDDSYDEEAGRRRTSEETTTTTTTLEESPPPKSSPSSPPPPEDSKEDLSFEGEPPFVTCIHCNRQSCVRCKIPAHPLLTCEEVHCGAASQATTAFIAATSKACPNCTFRITHYHGHACHHIRPGGGCPNCGVHFCYTCGRRGTSGSSCGCRLFCSSDDVIDNLDLQPFPHDRRCSCPICPDCRRGAPCSQCNGFCVVCRGVVRPAPTEAKDVPTWTPRPEDG